MSFFGALLIFSSLSFIVYGWGCLVSQRMKDEFLRYRLARFRSLVGWLELLGAVGLLAGLIYPPLGLVAASGLTVLMLMGFLVRRRIGDSAFQSFPALVYFIINLYLSAAFLTRILH